MNQHGCNNMMLALCINNQYNQVSGLFKPVLLSGEQLYINKQNNQVSVLYLSLASLLVSTQ